MYSDSVINGVIYSDSVINGVIYSNSVINGVIYSDSVIVFKTWTWKLSELNDLGLCNTVYRPKHIGLGELSTRHRKTSRHISKYIFKYVYRMIKQKQNLKISSVKLKYCFCSVSRINFDILKFFIKICWKI